MSQLIKGMNIPVRIDAIRDATKKLYGGGGGGGGVGSLGSFEPQDNNAMYARGPMMMSSPMPQDNMLRMQNTRSLVMGDKCKL